MTEIHDLSAIELAAAVRSRELSPVEITDHYLRRIDRLNAEVGAFFTVTAELARDQAVAAEKEVAGASDPASLPPLIGVPIPIKDLNMVAGVRQTFGSAVYEDYIPGQDDHVTAAIRAAGGVITGKTSTPEFGLACYTESDIGQPARTPWDLTRSAGGSSGGAAAAVAAGLAPAAQGNDGGGSIRIPASLCGLFGLKPSRGRISAGPIMTDMSGITIDGALTRTVSDAALLLDVMTGNEPGDLYTQPPLASGETFLSCATREPGKLRICRTLGNPVEGATVHPDCVAAYEAASELLASLGHEVIDVEMPFGPEMMPSFDVLWCAEAAAIPVDPSREDRLRPLTRYLRERAKALSAADLLSAEGYLQLQVRLALGVLNQYDAMLTPTLASPPVPVGYFEEVEPAENFERQKRFTPFVALFNVSGQPAVNMPLHWNGQGLPIGVMLAGRMGAEATLISLSAQLETARPWRDRHPSMW